jgi:hypothetical protein
LYRWRIPDRRSVATVVRALEADRIVAQPNYLFALQADARRKPKTTPRNTSSPSCVCRKHTRLPKATMCWWR